METLNRIYYSESGLGGLEKLYRKAKLIDSSVTYAMVKKFLSEQEVQQVFKRRIVKHHYPLIARQAWERVQIDLMDMSNESVRGFNWIFNCLDVYTRYCISVPLKAKSTSECVRAFKEILVKIGKLNKGIMPDQVDSDNESAFLSNEFKRICETHEMKQNLSVSGDKSPLGIVERFNGTLRSLIQKYKLVFETRDWVQALPKIIEGYNTSYHRTLKSEPINAMIDNSKYDQVVKDKIVKAKEEIYNSENIGVGSRVRLLIKRKLFEKGSNPTFTKTIHTVERIEEGTKYFVADRVHSYRKNELQLVNAVSQNPNIKLRTEKEEKKEVEAISDELRNRRINRRINKEGVDKNTHEPTSLEKTNRTLTRRPRDFGPFLS